ncbi:MAG TPA: hypothetical protein VG759_22965 [Candidatus Angelobacter sp.]|nr:hypothetical protein [Candidatus Angelobacter sp.]
MGLISSIIERAGIPTAGVSLLREVTEKVRPPRALYVPFPFGYPLGKPNQPALQHQVIEASLKLLTVKNPLPILADFAV